MKICQKLCPDKAYFAVKKIPPAQAAFVRLHLDLQPEQVSDRESVPL
jgi:hypothetical protein